MQNVSNAFKELLANDQRNYIEHVKFTLADGTILNLTNDDLWQNGFSVEDSVYPDSTFTVGGAIINKAKVVLNNIYGDFTDYDFMNAKMEMSVGLMVEGTEEVVKKGVFTVVDYPSYNGALITVEGLDNMHKFDIAYSDTTMGSKLGYPATLGAIVRDACSKCDVQLDNGSLQFPHYDYTVQDRPDDDSTTFREVISWAAQIAGCYCRCNVDGKLELKWFDVNALADAFGNLDGGTFDVGDLDYISLNPYLDTTDGMTQIVSSRQDDTNNTVTGVSWFTFNGNTADPIYVNSNSRMNFGGTAPSTSSSTAGHLNICRRDGQMLALYRQEGTAGSWNFLKLRFEGFTQYSTSSQTDDYALKYEVFLLSNGEIYINIIQLPTNASYMGSTAIVGTGGTTTFTPEVGSYILRLNSTSGAWTQKKVGVYTSGDTADGGRFLPWDIGYIYNAMGFSSLTNVHQIYSVFSNSVAMDDTVITGVNVRVRAKDSSGSDITIDYPSGDTGYVVSIEGNEFITTSTGAQVAGWLGTAICGMQFRKLNISHASDPTIEAGDIAIYWDRKRKLYPFIVSRTVFNAFGSAQNTICGSETPIRNSAARFSLETKNYVDIRRRLGDEKTDREQAMEDLLEQLNEQNQMYIDKEFDSGNNLTAIIIHNKPLVTDSDIVWKITTNAFGVSTDGGRTYNLGAMADGTLIAQVIQTIGLNASWINTGTLKVGGSNASTDGVIEVYNSSNTRVGRWDKTGFYQGNIPYNLSSPNTKIDNNGAITTKSLTANDYIYVNGNNDSSVINIPINYVAYSATRTGKSIIDKFGYSIQMNISSFSKFMRLNWDGLNFYDGADASSTTYSQLTKESFEIRNDNRQTFLINRVGGASTGSTMSVRTYTGSSTSYSNYVNVQGTGYVYASRNISCGGNMSCNGTKSRLVFTKDYSDRLLYCYETPSPLFGDVGEGKISDDGKCYVQIDAIFSQTVTLKQYQVFLQKYGDGDCWVSERNSSYFVVEGTVGLKFGWEIKAKQSDFDQYRLEKEVGDITRVSEDSEESTYDYAEELANHINSLKNERQVNAA